MPCGTPMCSECLRVHSKIQSCKRHKTLTLEEFRNKAREASKLNCKEHERVLEMYCNDCNVLVCINCTVLTHKDHKMVSIKVAAASHRETMGQYVQEVRKIIETTVVERNGVMEKSASFDQNLREAVELINEEVQRIISAVQLRAQQVSDELTYTSKRLVARGDTLDMIATTAAKCCDKAERSVGSSDLDVLASASSVIKHLKLLQNRKELEKANGGVEVNTLLSATMTLQCSPLFSLKYHNELFMRSTINFIDGLVSLILNETFGHHLVLMLGRSSPVNFKMIFTTDAQTVYPGETSCGKEFAKAVSGTSKYLCIIMSSNNHVFGAFVERSDHSDETKQPPVNESFIFSLSGQPVKLQYNRSGYYNGGTKFHIVEKNKDNLNIGNGELRAFDSYSCNSSNDTKQCAFTIFAPGYHSSIPLSPGTLCGTPGTATYELKRAEVYKLK